MKKNKCSFFYLLTGVFWLFFSHSVVALSVLVDCSTDSLQSAINNANPGDTLTVNGVCQEQITIKTNDLTLVGNSTGNNAEINGENLFFPTLIKIDSAVRVEINGFDINAGLFGIFADAGASFKITDSNISDLIIGMHLQNNSNVKLQNVLINNSSAIGLDVTSGSTAEVTNVFSVTNSSAFGLQVIDGGEMKVTEGAELTLTGNFLGAQISGGATLFADTDAKINADNNNRIGLSVNTGASMVMFNADISASGNGLDGLDVVSAANLDIDGNSTLTANNNGREGISLDNGSLNIFGFFSTEPNLPRIVANNNTNNGIQVEFGSKLDIGQNSSLEATNNGMAGILLDDGSSANIHDSVITDNHGMLIKKEKEDGDSNGKAKRSADIVATFGSRVSFRGNNVVGLALCDKTSMARGDVKCKD